MGWTGSHSCSWGEWAAPSPPCEIPPGDERLKPLSGPLVDGCVDGSPSVGDCVDGFLITGDRVDSALTV